METERLILCPFEETEGGYYEVKQEDVQNKPYCRIRVYAFCYAAEEHAVSFDVVEPSIRNKERVIQSLRSEPEVMYPGIGFYIQTALDV